jgi:hypothetical protein
MPMGCDDLTAPERRIWEAFPRGERVDLRTADPVLDDPARGGCWEDDRTVRSEVIRALLLGGPEAQQGAVACVRITGARIAGCLDLAHAGVRSPVYLQRCWFEEPPDLRAATAVYLDFSHSWLPGLMADDLRVDGHLILAGCRVDGRAGRPGPGSAVRRGLDGRALSATGITVTGSVFMNDRFTADGEVRLLAGHISGTLDLGGAQLRNRGAIALLAARLAVDDAVFCRDGFAADGEVVFRRARITGFLDLSGARMSNPGGRAFFAPVLTVAAGLFCHSETIFTGEVDLTDGHVSGILDLSGAKLRNPGHTALAASRLTVQGPVLCRDGFAADGEVTLRRAHITGFLDLATARLSNPGGYALFAPGITIDGPASFRDGTILDGRVSLDHAHITDGLDLAEASPTGDGTDALSCAYLTARQLTLPVKPVAGITDLSHAQIGILTAHPAGTPGGLAVDELTYDTLTPLLPATQRIGWLTNAHEGYLPQPYEQLAACYRRLGHDADARTVLLAKQRHRHQHMPLPLRLWGLLQDTTTGYGYRPGRAALWLSGLIAAGTIAFGLHHPVAARNSGDPEFNPFFYTLELLLPVISYGQQSAFNPTGAYQWLSYGLITAGWILATTIITGLSRALYRS